MTLRHRPARAIPTEAQLARRYRRIVAEEVDRLEGAIAREEAERHRALLEGR